jgi:hypothetical protein
MKRRIYQRCLGCIVRQICTGYATLGLGSDMLMITDHIYAASTDESVLHDDAERRDRLVDSYGTEHYMRKHLLTDVPICYPFIKA